MTSSFAVGRALVRAVLLATVLIATVAISVGHAQTFWLDTYDKHKDKFAGPVKTEKLVKNIPYQVSVKGTFSLFAAKSLRSNFCGTAESKPIYRTKGRRNGAVVADAEFLFADLSKNCARRRTPITGTVFEARLFRKYMNLVPIGGQGTAPKSNHYYRYAVLGRGRVAKFRLYDAFTKDNYGRLKIRISRARAKDCRLNGFVNWKYPDEASCVAATNIKVAKPKKRA